MAKGQVTSHSIKCSGGTKGIEIDTLLLAPMPITQNNLNLVIDAGWISKNKVCQGAQASVAACQ